MDLDELAGYVAAEANHAKDKEARETVAPATQPAEAIGLSRNPLCDAFLRLTTVVLEGPAHHWGMPRRIEYCAVQIGGEYFNVPARVLVNSIMPKRS
jgi:hypothetical protein